MEETANYLAGLLEIFRLKDRINSLTTSVFVLPFCVQYVSSVFISDSSILMLKVVLVIAM